MSHGDDRGAGLQFDFPVDSGQAVEPKATAGDGASFVFAAPAGGSSAAPTAILEAPAAADASVSADAHQLIDSIPSPPLAGNDIVDTFWDIPVIDIPSTETIARREKIQAKRQTASSRPLPSGGLPLFSTGSSRTAQAATEQFALEDFDFDSIISGSSEALAAKPGKHSDDPDLAPRSRVRQIVVSTIVLAIIIAMTIGGRLIWRQHRDTADYRQAMSACTAATGAYAKANAAMNTALRNTKMMQNIPSAQVADTATVTKLRDAVSAANRIGVAAGCPASMSAADLRTSASDARRLTEALNKSAGTVISAAKAVTASKSVKDSADAAALFAHLKTATADAQTLFENSRYNVADDSTRVALQSALKTANGLLAQSKPDTAAVQDALTGLQDAGDAVKSSMNDLVVQNQIAAQQQAQALRPTHTRTGTDTGGNKGGDPDSDLSKPNTDSNKSPSGSNPEPTNSEPTNSEPTNSEPTDPDPTTTPPDASSSIRR
jgi:hypothetical protein